MIKDVGYELYISDWIGISKALCGRIMEKHTPGVKRVLIGRWILGGVVRT